MIEPKEAPDHRHQCEDDCHSNYPDDELINLDLNREKFAPRDVPLDGITVNSESHRSGSDGEFDGRDEEVDSFNEPLGYQHFLYDVNIEYSPGGQRSSSVSSKHSFKLKHLPYMVYKNHLNSDYDDPQEGNNRRDSIASSTNSSNCCESDGTTQNDYISNAKHVDVTKATCAFLGNSDYVPNHIFGHRRVVLELISAKLSQSTVFNVPANHTNLVTLNEQPPFDDSNSTNTNNNIGTPSSLISRRRRSDNFSSNASLASISVASSDTSPSSPLSSKKFVNYTILIKTVPGLDKHPALIERRFSDFLLLYQGLKSLETVGKLVDRFITFPKKVYMGNFSLTNIAERSIEFSRLLNLCMTTTNLLWSAPFIAFLLDKELKEAHKLSLCGNPDDVQVLIETVYHIERKLYLRRTDKKLDANKNSSLSSTSLSTSNGSGTSSIATANSYSPLLTNGRSTNGSNNNNNISSDSLNDDKQISSNDPIINESTFSGQSDSNTSFQTNRCFDPNQSRHSIRNEMNDSSVAIESVGLSALNQRVLVTFCMLFLTYYRGENYRELKVVVKEFCHLISCREYVDSIISTRYYMTLRACLLFLMNMSGGNVIDENQRLWLKRKLEDIDGTQADFAESINAQNNVQDPYIRVRRQSGAAVNGGSDLHRILTKGDLMSLVRDRNFCSFQMPVVGKSNQKGRS